MHIRGIGVIVAVAGVAASAVLSPRVAGQAPPRLVQPSTLVKLGTFTMPAAPGGRGFEWGGTALAYNTVNDSLFIVGHDWDQLMAEVTIPPDGGTASILQPLQDPAEGRSVGESDAKVGGALVHGGRLWFTKYIYYDAEAAQTASHFNRPLNLATTGQVVGPQSIGPLAAGFVSGYLGRIPAEWQTRLGGSVLTGNCCLSILSRTSYGPAASAWTPGQTTSTPLVYYTIDHQTLGTYGAPGSHPRFNGTTRIKGIAFPEGTDSVLFFGRTGIGPYCYGDADECGDPVDESRGEHAYPYRMYVWAYDAHDLAAVRAGTLQPWQVEPYAVWDLGIDGVSEFSGHAAYDPATARIFVSEVRGNGDLPLIHVFTAGLAQPAPTVTAVTPSTGTTAGGTVVMFAGTNFTTGATVTLGGVAATTVTVLSATSIRATTGAHAAGPVDLIVRNPDGQQATLAGGFTYAVFADPPPSVTSVSPGSGPTSGGTTVTISGFGFRTGAAVAVGGTEATGVSLISSTSMTASTPAGTMGTVDVRVTNADGQAGTLVGGFTYEGSYRRYFAEGATIPPFDCRFVLANVGNADADVILRFLKIDGTVVSTGITVPAFGRRTVDAKDVTGLESAEFSTLVESDALIVADRTMTWDASGYGSHAETSLAGPATVWYLAEGATHSNFDLFYTIQNPNSAAARVVVRYLLPGGRAPIDKVHSVPARSRFTIWVDNEDLPAGSGNRPLESTDVSARIVSDLPIIVERSMYLSTPEQLFRAGHAGSGVTTPALNWFLSEGATGSYFDLFVLIANPNDNAAQVKATYLHPDGTTLTKDYEVPANSRFNIWVDNEEFPSGSGNRLLADAEISTTISSTNSVPIIVERAMWWPGPTPATWAEAHTSSGSTATGTRWALADGEMGGTRGIETYVTIANTSTFAGQARVTLYFEDGSAALEATVELPAQSRTNVYPPAVFPAAFPSGVNRRFASLIESLGTTPAQIVVERSMYSNTGGVAWGAGTNALATRLQ